MSRQEVFGLGGRFDEDLRETGGQFILELRLLARVHGTVTRPPCDRFHLVGSDPESKFIYLFVIKFYWLCAWGL